jgi:hypothetical protein
METDEPSLESRRSSQIVAVTIVDCSYYLFYGFYLDEFFLWWGRIFPDVFLFHEDKVQRIEGSVDRRGILFRFRLGLLTSALELCNFLIFRTRARGKPLSHGR